MKKVLFKGWCNDEHDIETDRWVYGVPLVIDGETTITKSSVVSGQVRTFGVDERSIGQFTGKTDSNGTDIYQNDFLYNAPKNITYKVVWNEEMCCWWCERVNGRCDGQFLYYVLKDPEFIVVGNAYEQKLKTQKTTI